jgi:hypothetical protein
MIFSELTVPNVPYAAPLNFLHIEQWQFAISASNFLKLNLTPPQRQLPFIRSTPIFYLEHISDVWG